MHDDWNREADGYRILRCAHRGACLSVVDSLYDTGHRVVMFHYWEDASQDHAHEGGVARTPAEADRLFGAYVDRMLAGDQPRRPALAA
jgi:hypothetical protein